MVGLEPARQYFVTLRVISNRAQATQDLETVPLNSSTHSNMIAGSFLRRPQTIRTVNSILSNTRTPLSRTMATAAKFEWLVILPDVPGTLKKRVQIRESALGLLTVLCMYLIYVTGSISRESCLVFRAGSLRLEVEFPVSPLCHSTLRVVLTIFTGAMLDE